MRVPGLRQARLWVVIGLVVAALMSPTWPVNRPVPRFVALIDITQSMNAEDYRLPGWPRDRLSMVKASLLAVLPRLPCASELGLALFTNKELFTLFEPLPVCQHYSELADTLEHLDWRMAWAADSHVARGLFNALRQVGEQSPPALVFFTDGQQTPSRVKPPPFLLDQEQVTGLIVGVGQTEPVLVPKFDVNGVKTGYWQRHEAESLPGKPPVDTKFYYSSLAELALQELAEKAGLAYHHLETPELLYKALMTGNMQVEKPLPMSLAGVLSGLALLIWIAPLLPRPSLGAVRWRWFESLRRGG